MEILLLALCLLLFAQPSCAQTQDHFFLYRLGVGASQQFTGDVEIMTLFIDAETSTWTQDAKDKYFAEMREAKELLMNAAQAQGVELNLNSASFHVTVPKGADWYDYTMLDYFKCEDMQELQQIYEEKRGRDETPFIFAFNSKDRCYSFAVNTASETNAHAQEYTVIHAKRDKLSRTLAHELLHQFGAVDYYFPDAVKEAAKADFSDSIMNTKGTTVDDLTAYMIGWREDLCLPRSVFWMRRRSSTKTSCPRRSMTSGRITSNFQTQLPSAAARFIKNRAFLSKRPVFLISPDYSAVTLVMDGMTHSLLSTLSLGRYTRR